MRLLLTSLFLLAATFLYAQDLSKTEKAIKQVIEDETHQINQNNYEGWAAHWVHDGNAYLSVAGPDFHMEMLSWETISKWAKKEMADRPVQAYDQQKSNYKFTINGEMAYVTFMEDGSQSTRVLIKKDGSWKIIRVDVVLSSAYKQKEWLKGFESSVGTWNAKAGTVKNSNAFQMKMKDITYCTKISGHNFIVKSKENWTEADGSTSWTTEEFRIPMYMEDEVIITHNVFSDDWSTLATGTCKFLEGGGMEIHTTRITDGTKYCDFKITPTGESGQGKVTAVYFNAQGEEMMNTEVVLVKEEKEEN